MPLVDWILYEMPWHQHVRTRVVTCGCLDRCQNPFLIERLAGQSDRIGFLFLSWGECPEFRRKNTLNSAETMRILADSLLTARAQALLVPALSCSHRRHTPIATCLHVKGTLPSGPPTRHFARSCLCLWSLHEKKKKKKNKKRRRRKEGLLLESSCWNGGPSSWESRISSAQSSNLGNREVENGTFQLCRLLGGLLAS